MGKKGRPAFLLSVLCTESNLDPILERIFTETPTLGVRMQIIQRAEIGRSIETIQHPKFGAVNIKVGFYDSEPIKIEAEYDMCSEIAQQWKVPLREVQQEMVQTYQEQTKNWINGIANHSKSQKRKSDELTVDAEIEEGMTDESKRDSENTCPKRQC